MSRRPCGGQGLGCRTQDACPGEIQGCVQILGGDEVEGAGGERAGQIVPFGPEKVADSGRTAVISRALQGS